MNFYVNILGFTLLTDQPMGPGFRWIEIRPPKGEAGIALFTPPGLEDRIGTFTGISFECDDVQKTFEELTLREWNSRSHQRRSHGAWRRS